MNSKVELVALRCPGCGATLAITDTYRCDCMYCFSRYIVTNLPEIVQAVKEEKSLPKADYFLVGGVDDIYTPYFYKRCCDSCRYWKYESGGPEVWDMRGLCIAHHWEPTTSGRGCCPKWKDKYAE